MPRPNARPLKRNALTILAPNPPPTPALNLYSFISSPTQQQQKKKVQIALN